MPACFPITPHAPKDLQHVFHDTISEEVDKARITGRWYAQHKRAES
jgi:hypothetical protein